MSEAYLMSLPVIVNCLGGEMIYILCSRLKAQKISLDKSIKVIKDIGNILLNKKFQSELYIHKKPYKHQEVKSIFESFAHSSIMRLNTTSMNKLFELMLMTLKLQILRSRYPEELYQITLNHYQGILDILTSIENDDNSLIVRVQEEILHFKQVYSKLSPYDYIILKSVILRFLQGKNVKVSIFIQDNLQDGNSIIYLPMNEEAPPLVGKIGQVKKFSNGRKDQNFFELKISECYKENKNKSRMDNFSTELGKNMFGSEKLKLIGRIKKQEQTTDKDKENETKKNDEKEKENNREDNIRQREEHKEIENAKKINIQDSIFGYGFNKRQLTNEDMRIISQGNKKDLNLFTSVFANENDDGDLFEFDLFGLNDNNNSNDDKKDENFINIETTKSDIKTKMNQQFDNLNNLKKEEDEDDLLDLMDKNI